MARNRAVGIVVHHGQLLVIRRKLMGNDYVVFPGGGIEAGESPEEAVVREIKEEASMDVSVLRPLYHLTYPNSDQHFFFLCAHIKGDPKLGDGNEKISMEKGEGYYEPKWLPIIELDKTLLLPLEIRDWLIEDLRNNFKNPDIREGVSDIYKFKNAQ